MAMRHTRSRGRGVPPLHTLPRIAEKFIVQAKNVLMVIAVAALHQDGHLYGVNARHRHPHIDPHAQFFYGFALHLFGVLFHRFRWRRRMGIARLRSSRQIVNGRRLRSDSRSQPVVLRGDFHQHFATVGESEPTGDEKFFSLSRQPKCIPIIATQSISSLKSALPGETWRTLLQTFRTKIFLALSDDFSARTASELCGREDKLKVSYNLSESGHDARISLLTGKALSHKSNITASKSYNTHTDFRFDMKTFTELRNAQSVTIAYDGTNPLPPMFCYLKPYFNDPNKSYFRQLADGEL